VCARVPALPLRFKLCVERNRVRVEGNIITMPGERTLPVRRSKDLIVDKVKLNRVTLISADTGSGACRLLPSPVYWFVIAWIGCRARSFFCGVFGDRSLPLSSTFSWAMDSIGSAE